MSTSEGAQEAARYFEARPALHRLLAASRATYERLSRVGGQAALDNPSVEEIRALRDFLGRRPTVQDGRLAVTLQDLDERLRRARFACGLPDLLAAYYGVEIHTRLDLRRHADAAWHAFALPFDSLLAAAQARAWWDDDGSRQVRRLWRESLRQDGGQPGSATGALQAAVRHVLVALSDLPSAAGGTELLPVFAHRITGDPHAFDADTVGGRLLLSALSIAAGGAENADADPLAWAGIARDDVSSQVLAAGVDSVDASLPTWPVSLPMLTLARWNSARAHGGVAYVVENPSVFRELCLAAAVPGRPARTLVCPSGQPSAAALRLLDLLVADGAELRYAGDFDPAGLSIAARLLERYGAHLRLWFMDVAAYHAALEQQPPNAAVQSLTSAEKEQLTRLRQTLPDLAAALLERGAKAFQEGLIPAMRAALEKP